jgi:exopolysaccharide biosynthesis polyprenyl glycosylphosphotransferase
MKFDSRLNSQNGTSYQSILPRAVPDSGIHLSDSSPGIWLRCLAWPFGSNWKTILTIGFGDILGATLGLLIGYIFSIRLFNVNANLAAYYPDWVCYCIFLVSIYFLKGGYEGLNKRRPENELELIVIGSWWAIILLSMVNFMIYKGTIFSRLILFLGYIFSLAFIIIFRFGLRIVLKTLWTYGIARKNTIIVGDKLDDIQWLIKHLHTQGYRGVNILGYIAATASHELNNIMKYLGNFENLPRIAEVNKVDKIIFAMRGYSDNRYNTLLSRLIECERLNIESAVMSRIFNNFYFSLKMDSYSGIFGVARKKPKYTRLAFRVLKRTIDILGSLTMLVASLPIWIIAIIGIKLYDGGPIFFRHTLVGREGKPLHILKFRTMVLNAQEILNADPQLLAAFRKNFKLKDDPRITRVGKWLRRTSLDELPQFINILKGDMSMIGPRPVKQEELERYGEFKYERIKVRPGLTGFWQVNGRCSTTYTERIQMDKFYLYNASIWLDLIILFQTPLKVLRGHGAV